MFASDNTKLDLSVSVGASVNSRADDARRGMPDLDPAIEADPPSPRPRYPLAMPAPVTVAAGRQSRSAGISSAFGQAPWRVMIIVAVFADRPLVKKNDSLMAGIGIVWILAGPKWP
ncbi:MAG: hypothetical protein ACYC9L_00100 [Sulfuricaulis sp.]